MFKASKLKTFLERKQISIYKFEQELGLSNGTIRKAIEKDSDLKIKTLEKIISCYPDLSINWLLFNTGDMLITKIQATNQSVKKIPFYDTIAVGGTQSIANLDVVVEPSEYINSGDWFINATGAMRVHGNSMYPKYASGSIITFKEVLDRELIIYGQDYVIETSEYRILKRIQKGDSKNFILACSYNEEVDNKGKIIHEQIEVSFNKIQKLFRVLGKVEYTENSNMIYSNSSSSVI